VHFWLITVGEPLPQLSGESRLWRTGMVAGELVRRGHRVTWWTSSVDHFRKEFFGVTGKLLQIAPGFVLRFLCGRLYRKNLSLDRLLNHWQIGREFRRECGNADAPDAILCSFPTIELSLEAVRFAKRNRIPVLLDVRDLWPDIFPQAAPAALRPLVRLAFSRYFSATRRALRDADALIAVSDGYLDWGLARAGRARRSLDRVFPLAYSLPEVTAESRAAGLEMLHRYGVDERSIVCLFAGTMGRTYDFAPVLECARRFSRDGLRRFHFLFCGDGERAPHWRGAAEGLPNVSFTGWLDQSHLRAALSAAHIGLAAYAPAAPQGLPNKVIEYLAAGLPVLSSLTGETARLLADAQCGLTYDAGDASSLANALLSLQSPDARQPLAMNARRTFEARFRAETVYARLADHLESVAAAARRDGVPAIPSTAIQPTTG